MKLALFPLPVFLLPGGKTQLRIFETRYERMVSESLKTGNGFGICSFAGEDHQKLLESGTRVTIYDFEKLDDGTLGVSVIGQDRFIIDKYHIEDDGLRMADVSIQTNWPEHKLTPEYQHVADSLHNLMDEHPLYSADEVNQNLGDLTWVCQRWLELLPVPVEKKQQVFLRADFVSLLKLLQEIIQQQSDPHTDSARN